MSRYQQPRPSGDFKAKTVREIVLSAKRSRDSHGDKLQTHYVSEYAAMRLLVDEDGQSGFAIRVSEVVSVFSRRDRLGKRTAQALVRLAIALSGKLLNTCTIILPAIYGLSGFPPFAWPWWSGRQAHENSDFAPMSDEDDVKQVVGFMVGSDKSLPVPYVPHCHEADSPHECVIEAEFWEDQS